MVLFGALVVFQADRLGTKMCAISGIFLAIVLALIVCPTPGLIRWRTVVEGWQFNCPLLLESFGFGWGGSGRADYFLNGLLVVWKNYSGTAIKGLGSYLDHSPTQKGLNKYLARMQNSFLPSRPYLY